MSTINISKWNVLRPNVYTHHRHFKFTFDDLFQFTFWVFTKISKVPFGHLRSLGHNSVVYVSLFWEEISVCAAVPMSYVMDVCDCVWYIILLPHMMNMSFMLVTPTRLIVSEPKHWVTWSHRTGVNFSFLRGKRA